MTLSKVANLSAAVIYTLFHSSRRAFLYKRFRNFRAALMKSKLKGRKNIDPANKQNRKERAEFTKFNILERRCE